MPERGTITGSAAAGTEIATPICITMHIKDGKFDRFNEYLDLATFSGVNRICFPTQSQIDPWRSSAHAESLVLLLIANKIGWLRPRDAEWFRAAGAQ
jgi:hypothetical protein